MRLFCQYLPVAAIPIVDYQGDWFYVQEEIIPTDPFGGSSTSNITFSTTTGTSGGAGSTLGIRGISGGGATSATTTSNYARRWYWNFARSGRRCCIPLIDIRLDHLISFLREEAYPLSGDFYVVIRSSYEFPGYPGRTLIAGIAIFPEGTFQERPSPFDLELLHRFCTLRTRDPEPEDEALARAWREIQATERYFEAEHQNREEALGRSWKLLKAQLTEEQVAELEDHGYFTMVARDGRPYRISKKTHGNVWLLNPEGQEMVNFCIVTEDSSVPIFDQMLSQKLMLEYHPEAFFRVANARVILPEVRREQPVAPAQP